MDGSKAYIHARKLNIYNSEKEPLVKGGYSVEVSEKDKNKEIW